MAGESLRQWLMHTRDTQTQTHGLRLECTASGGFAAQVGAEQEHQPSFDDLPYEIRLAILERLDPSSILAASQTCRSWRMVASDRLLWRAILERDMANWPYVSHLSQPNHHLRFRSPKQIYLQCSPLSRNGLAREQRIIRTATTQRLGARRVAVFGLGLEHAASSLVDNLLWDAQSPFRVVGMSPGIEGIGGGVSLRHHKGFELDMIVLFQKTAAERRHANDHDRGHLAQGLSPAARAVCAGVHGYIFVVDATRMAVDAANGTALHQERAVAELQQLLNPAWAPRLAPLLVLACHGRQPPPLAVSAAGLAAVAEADAQEGEAAAGEDDALAEQAAPGDAVEPMTCIEVADALRLATLAPRPWRVETVDVSAFSEPITRGSQWLQANS